MNERSVNEPQRVLLVDGTCVFCNRLVQRILRWDRRGQFHFAHLQSEYARGLLASHGQTPDIDGIYLVDGVGTERERVLIDGAAGRVIWPALFFFLWPMRLVPVFLLDVWYRLFARVRYRLFGQAEVCIVPGPSERARFVERSVHTESTNPSSAELSPSSSAR